MTIDKLNHIQYEEYRRFLKQYRLKLGYSKRYVCRSAEISYNTLTNIEEYKVKEPRISVLEKLADVYEITLAEVFNCGLLLKRE